MSEHKKNCPISDPPQRVCAKYLLPVHALLRPRSQCEHKARRDGPDVLRLFPLLAEGGGVGELGEPSAIISPDRPCFRPDAVGNANCANTACSSPSFDGQIGTGIHEGACACAC